MGSKKICALLIVFVLSTLSGCGGKVGDNVNSIASTPSSPMSQSSEEATSSVATNQGEGKTSMSDEQLLNHIGADTPNNRTQGRFLYKTANGVELHFYLSQPTAKKYEKAPLLVNFVGPGWTMLNVKSPITYMDSYYGTLLQEGFANLTVSYRGMENGASMSELFADLMDAMA